MHMLERLLSPMLRVATKSFFKNMFTVAKETKNCKRLPPRGGHREAVSRLEIHRESPGVDNV